MAEKVIRTAIVERRPEWREKLVSLINLTPGFFCTGNYADVRDALSGFAARLPDVVLCNFHLADESERKFVRALRKKHPALPILVLNFYGDGAVFDKITAGVARLLSGFLSAEKPAYELTPHEQRLLGLLVEGHSYKGAARLLNVSYNTVKFHMRRVFQKLEVNSKSAAVAKAMRHRLIN